MNSNDIKSRVIRIVTQQPEPELKTVVHLGQDEIVVKKVDTLAEQFAKEMLTNLRHNVPIQRDLTEKVAARHEALNQTTRGSEAVGLYDKVILPKPCIQFTYRSHGYIWPRHEADEEIFLDLVKHTPRICL
jgi:hypothetical protein